MNFQINKFSNYLHMKKYLFLLLFAVLSVNNLFCQIYSNIETIRISNAKFMPPDLRAKFSFEDYNGNNVLEALETAQITMIISNVGKGVAKNLYLTVVNDQTDKNLIIRDKLSIAELLPGQTDTFKISLSTNFEISSKIHNLTINVAEDNGFDMEPIYLKLPTIEYQKPELKLIGLNIIETGDDLYVKNYDGKVEKGERVKVKLSIQNVGKNLAQNVNFKVTTNNSNIQLFENTLNIGDVKVGEVKEFTFVLMPNNKVQVVGNLPLFLDANVKYDYGKIAALQLPISFDQKPPEPQIVDIKPDYNSFNNQVVFDFSDNDKYSINKELSVDNEIPKNNTKENSYALIIGNSNYSENLSDLADLRYTLNDARVFKKYAVNVLGVPDDNQHIYYAENANKTTMIKNLGSFKSLIASNPDAVFYVYYSGHGAQNKDSIPFLMPVDATISMIDELAIKLEDFYKYLTPPNNNTKVIVFLDACFSGEKLSVNTKVGLRRTAKNTVIESNMIILAASSGSEVSQEYESKSYGLFTFFLLKILQDTKGKITYGELATRLIEEVHLTSLNPQNGFVEQKPQANAGKNLGETWKNWLVY